MLDSDVRLFYKQMFQENELLIVFSVLFSQVLNRRTGNITSSYLNVAWGLLSSLNALENFIAPWF